MKGSGFWSPPYSLPAEAREGLRQALGREDLTDLIEEAVAFALAVEQLHEPTPKEVRGQLEAVESAADKLTSALGGLSDTAAMWLHTRLDHGSSGKLRQLAHDVANLRLQAAMARYSAPRGKAKGSRGARALAGELAGILGANGVPVKGTETGEFVQALRVLLRANPTLTDAKNYAATAHKLAKDHIRQRPKPATAG